MIRPLFNHLRSRIGNNNVKKKDGYSLQLYKIFCSCLKPSTKKTENLRTRRNTSKQQHHYKRGECNSLTTALQRPNLLPDTPAAAKLAARRPCSNQLPPDGPAAANCRQRDLQLQRPRPAPHVPQNLLCPPPCPPGSGPRSPGPSQSADPLLSSPPSSHSLLSPRSPYPNQS